MKRQVLREACEAAGRDPGTVRLARAPNFQLFDGEREFARWRQGRGCGMSSEEDYAYICNRGALYGIAFAIEETIEESTAVGCRGFIDSCKHAPDASGLQQLTSLASVRQALAQL